MHAYISLELICNADKCGWYYHYFILVLVGLQMFLCRKVLY